MLMNKVKVIAHRGNFLPEGPIPEVVDKYSIPENTLEAFQRAFKNLWGIETDIRLAGDGNFVVIHDGDIKRFSDTEGLIDQMDTSQIKQVSYKTYPQFKIPTLDELCQLAINNTGHGQPPFIAFQIKRGTNPDSGLEVGRAVARKMEQYDLKDSIIFDATLEEAQILHAEFPWLNLSVSVGEANYSPTIYTPSQVLTDEFRKVFNGIWADEWKKPGSIYSQEMFEKLRKSYSGRVDVISPELHYNEDHPLSKDLEGLKKLWQEISSWGIADGICTDYPSQLDRLLQSLDKN